MFWIDLLYPLETLAQEKVIIQNSVNEVAKELFEGDNIVMTTNTDHGQSELISGPFVKNVEAETE